MIGVGFVLLLLAVLLLAFGPDDMSAIPFIILLFLGLVFTIAALIELAL